MSRCFYHFSSNEIQQRSQNSAFSRAAILGLSKGTERERESEIDRDRERKRDRTYANVNKFLLWDINYGVRLKISFLLLHLLREAGTGERKKFFLQNNLLCENVPVVSVMENFATVSAAFALELKYTRAV